MIYENRCKHAYAYCKDIYVEPETNYIILWQKGTDPEARDDFIQITSLDDCNRLIELLKSVKDECWKEPKP